MAKGPGGAVTAGEPLFVTETEKADVVVEVPVSGTVVELLGDAKTVYPIGAVVAVIETDMA